jgi:hypothetical protein
MLVVVEWATLGMRIQQVCSIFSLVVLVRTLCLHSPQAAALGSWLGFFLVVVVDVNGLFDVGGY